MRLRQGSPPETGQIWLPLVAWNGRLRGAGGGGSPCGISYSALARALQSSYAAVSADCGHPVRADTGGIREIAATAATAFYGTGPGWHASRAPVRKGAR